MQSMVYGVMFKANGVSHTISMQPTGRNTRSSQAEYGAILLAGAFRRFGKGGQIS